MKSFLPLLAILFSTLTACGIPVSYDPCSTSAGCSDSATSADDDDATPPTPAECDPSILDEIVEALECPEGTFPANATVTCADGNWAVQLNCPPFPPETVENDCDADLDAATLACLAGGGSLDEFACDSAGYSFSCEYPSSPAGDCSEEIVASAAICPEGSYLANFACDGETGSTITQCIPFLPEEESTVDCEGIAVTAASMCDGEDSYLASFTCDDEGVVVTCSESTDGGDDDDTTAGDDDDDDTTASADVLGNYGCVHPYDTAIVSWIATNGLPTNLVRQDNDSDGVYDEVWISTVLAWDELSILDLDNNGSVDSSDWECNSWADGTADDVDNDGDGYTELGGDLDDGTAGNRPGATDTCGDGLDNDYDALLDEECTSDVDGDGENELAGDCNDATTSIGVAPVYEYNDGIDNDCDGSIDEPSSVDGDGDGYTEEGGDCNDAAASIYPSAFDWGGDGVDQDCDGTDE